ncbi:nitrate reductase molybdenum cofactor assembly chaperone [Aeromicrobium sp. IC_218]|uniref:nitrate reductase molybdenum cofactor assembly chaperone n=1 Tax=Aeromicrobium sp. IC_218 TaxID=2545468 RepID=UPI00103DB590|nr:nitrate reductase molybdenum cofactor assembly chaperone [Aeromicrobium sp. IC_218]TCI97658.1 nitrate reductase molybdenum cofactor assembly chaperone [Aeromicrobium sp. IC_218]
MRRRRADETATRVTYQVASWTLGYPDEDLLARVPALRAALDEHPGVHPGLRELVDHLASTPLDVLQTGYVDLFDLSRKHALHLSYWTDGDTRRRGEVLGRFKSAYRASGFLVDTGGELPDHLSMVLEFAAVADLAAGSELLLDFRPALELVRLALLDRGTPYAGALAAVCATLPGESPADRRAAMAMAGPPAPEAVGLEPYDPRLLPVLDGTRA